MGVYKFPIIGRSIVLFVRCLRDCTHLCRVLCHSIGVASHELFGDTKHNVSEYCVEIQHRIRIFPVTCHVAAAAEKTLQISVASPFLALSYVSISLTQKVLRQNRSFHNIKKAPN